MQLLGETGRHVRLVMRMGQAAGVDLAAAYDSGAISQQGWCDLVRSCRGCAWAEGCADWLDRQPQRADPPEPCRNRVVLMALGRAQAANRQAEPRAATD